MNFEQFLRYVQEFPKIPSLIAWIHAGSHRKAG